LQEEKEAKKEGTSNGAQKRGKKIPLRKRSDGN